MTAPEIGAPRPESLGDTLLLTKTCCAPPTSILKQQHSGRKAKEGSRDEVQKEELTSLGFQNKNSYLGSEKTQRERIQSDQWTEKYGLPNPPLCIKIFMKKKENTPTHQNTVQMFATEDL